MLVAAEIMARTEVIFMAFRNFLCNRPWCGAQDLRCQDRRLLCIMARFGQTFDGRTVRYARQ